MQNFYFTFGSAKHFPFKDAYVTIRAVTLNQAIETFRKYIPDIADGTLNCAFYYDQQEWDANKCQQYYPNGPVMMLEDRAYMYLVDMFIQDLPFNNKSVSVYRHPVTSSHSDHQMSSGKAIRSITACETLADAAKLARHLEQEYSLCGVEYDYEIPPAQVEFADELAQAAVKTAEQETEYDRD